MSKPKIMAAKRRHPIPDEGVQVGAFWWRTDGNRVEYYDRQSGEWHKFRLSASMLRTATAVGNELGLGNATEGVTR